MEVTQQYDVREPSDVLQTLDIFREDHNCANGTLRFNTPGWRIVLRRERRAHYSDGCVPYFVYCDDGSRLFVHVLFRLFAKVKSLAVATASPWSSVAGMTQEKYPGGRADGHKCNQDLHSNNRNEICLE